jgi:hypothetical protein
LSLLSSAFAVIHLCCLSSIAATTAAAIIAPATTIIAMPSLPMFPLLVHCHVPSSIIVLLPLLPPQPDDWAQWN